MKTLFYALAIAGAVAAFADAAPAQTVAPKPGAYRAPRTIDGQPDLQGIWNIGTVTPLARPAELKRKEFFTPEEARAFEKRRVAQANRDRRDGSAEEDVARAYNDVFNEPGTRVVRTLRTSIVVDPPDGMVPPLTPAAAKAQADALARQNRAPWGPEDRPFAERCLLFPTSSPPMMSYAYNNNYRIVQNKDTVAIYVELLHDVRVIPLAGRPHPPSTVQQWRGDSRGHWEGDTLVVDTTNFKDFSSAPPRAFPFHGSDENLHVIERFSRLDPETILYQFAVDDPTAFTRPWKGELTLSAESGPIYEYACHEGNYGMANLLRGARVQEAEQAAGRK